MKHLKKYKTALLDVKKYLQEDLSSLGIESALIYGSSTYPKGFIDGVSDIDICAYSQEIKKENYSKIVEAINDTGIDYGGKPPKLIKDHIANRVEFNYQHDDIKFDIMIIAPELPNKDIIKTSPKLCNIDMLVGTLYQYGIPLYGEVPDRENVQKNFLPFHSDNVRDIRLEDYGDRVKRYNQRIDVLAHNKDGDILDHMYKSKEYFTKWLFSYKRKYPVNLNKHLEFQMQEILGLDEKEAKTVLFTNEDKNIFESAKDFVNLSKRYFLEYEKEKYFTEKSKKEGAIGNIIYNLYRDKMKRE